ncbi:DUF6531 domain-containing protein [Kitasatospora sp. NPDC008050]|uniref:DUF6531 domain-containing protein n=1 Tax=Kitasatospora sp. NPDC008050 TaxID=3364021 RepID=UPI0036E5A998
MTDRIRRLLVSVLLLVLVSAAGVPAAWAGTADRSLSTASHGRQAATGGGTPPKAAVAPKPLTLDQKRQQAAKLNQAPDPVPAPPAGSVPQPTGPGYQKHQGPLPQGLPAAPHPTGPAKSMSRAAQPADATSNPYISNLHPYTDNIQAGNTLLSWCVTWDFTQNPPAKIGTQGGLGAVSVYLYRSSDNVQMDFQPWMLYKSTGYCAIQPQLVAGVNYYAVVVYSYQDGTTDRLTSVSVPPVPIVGIPANAALGCPGSPDSSSMAPDLNKSCGDPVNTATGAFGENATDAALAAPGTPFQLTRTYTSDNAATGVFGPGWVFPYSASLLVGQSVVSFISENGSQTDYTVQSDGSLQNTRPYTRSKLQKTAGGYQLTATDQHTLLFDASGRLTGMLDPYGVGLSFGYTGNQLTGLTDAAGHTVAFGYTGSLLTTATLPGQRTITYSYTGGRLTGVQDLRGQTTSYGYDATSGLLTSVTDPLGHVVTSNSYDSSGRVIGQTDALGGRTTFGYDTANPGTTYVTSPDGGIWTHAYVRGVISWESDPYGKTTKYGYDASFNRTSLTDPNGNTTTSTFDANGNVLTRTAPSSVPITETWTYDGANHVTSYKDGLGNSTTHTYNSHGQLASSTDPTGATNAYTYTALGAVATVTDPRGQVTTNGYDGAGNRTSISTPLGEKTTYTYDAYGRVATVTDPRGNAAGANPAAYTTSYGYDAGDLTTSVTDPLGNTTGYGYDADRNLVSAKDALGNTTSYGYDAAGHRTTVKDPAGNTTTTSYDSAGDVTSDTDALGNRTTYGYDHDNHRTTLVTARGNAAGATAASYTWSYGYDANGNQTAATDPTGAVTATAYDAVNRPVTVTDPLGNVTTTSYDATGHALSVTDPTTAKTSYGFDTAGRLTSTTDPLGKTTSYTYDAAGNRLSQTTAEGDRTTWTYDADGRLATAVDPRGNVTGATAATYTTSYGYDAAGHATGVKDPLGNTTSTAFDALGRPTSVTDPLGRTTSTAYNALGQVTTVTDPANAVTTNAWNGLGERTSRTDANGHVTGYGYDALHRPSTVTDPLGHQVAYGYDPDGHTTTTVNARGATATTGYDPRGLPTGTSYSDNTPAVSQTYDKAGRPATVTDATGTRTFGYDAAGRLTSVSAPGGGSGFGYTYDADGNLTLRQYPDGEKIGYAYDGERRETQLTADGTSTTYAYDPAGHLTSTTLPSSNGYVESRGYDADGRLSSIGSTKGGSTLDSWQLTRDAAGQPTTVGVSRLGITTPQQTYGYDQDGRVTSATTASGTAGYTYDGVGNRKTMVNGTRTTSYSYDAADELTTSASGFVRQNYTYDADGNYTGNGSSASTVSYDFSNHPIAAVQAGVGYTFTNDAQGNRVTTSSGGSTVRTALWDINNALPQLATETNATGAVTGDYTYDPLGLPQSQRTSGATSYDHHDWLGSITDLTDANGAQQSRMSYDAFGQQSTTAVAANAPVSPFGFAGQDNDPTLTGKQDNRARDYDPSTGRFTGRDPLPTAAASSYGSAYVYAADAPTDLVDPSGQCSAKAWLTDLVTIHWGLDGDKGKCADEDAKTAQTSPLAAAASQNLERATDQAIQKGGDFSAGFLDSTTFGLMSQLDPNFPGNACDPAFRAGSLAGMVTPWGGLEGEGAELAAQGLAAVGKEVAGKPTERIALGLSRGLIKRATDSGARHLMDPGLDWKTELTEAIKRAQGANPTTTFDFYMDGLSADRLGLDSGASLKDRITILADYGDQDRGGPVAWEVSQLRAAGLLSRLSFFEDGAALQNPF